MNKLENLKFLNSSEELKELKSLKNPQKIKEYFQKNNIDISLEKAEEIKGWIYAINELDRKDPKKINELYENLSNNLNPEILEAAGGNKTINNIVKVGVAAIVIAGGCKVAWDIKNECQDKEKFVGQAKGAFNDILDTTGAKHKGIYDTLIGKAADGVIELGKKLKD